MIPLPIINVLFDAYIQQQHYRVATYLPSRQCMKTDLENGSDFDLTFVKDAYVQDELQTKFKLPEVTASQRKNLRQQGIVFSTDELTSLDRVSIE